MLNIQYSATTISSRFRIVANCVRLAQAALSPVVLGNPIVFRPCATVGPQESIAPPEMLRSGISCHTVSILTRCTQVVCLAVGQLVVWGVGLPHQFY